MNLVQSTSLYEGLGIILVAPSLLCFLLEELGVQRIGGTIVKANRRHIASGNER